MAELPSLPIVGDAPPCETEPCSQCCHDIEMLLTNDDLERLWAARPAEAFWFEADDGYLQLKTRDGPPARGSEGGKPCWFLGDDGRCTVWSERPEGCRLYPAVWDDSLRAAVLDTDYCPHTDGFRLPKSMDDATRRLAARLEAEMLARVGSA